MSGIAIKLWLLAGEPLLAIHPSGHDDRLFLRVAESLIIGEWLGTYNSMTLIKGVGYPLWLAFNYWLGLPLHFSQGLLYMLAGLMLVYALHQLGMGLGILTMLSLLYLFNPMFETYVTRDGIYPALTVFVIAGLVGWQVSFYESTIKQVLWSIFLGISLIGFWLTREEGVWLLPTILLYAGYTVWCSITIWRRETVNGRLTSVFVRSRSILIFLPFIILFAGIQSCAMINYWYYGTYTVIELQTHPFTSAYGALTRVEPIQWQVRIPVSKEMRERIYVVSPAFRELQPWLEGDFGRSWIKGHDTEIDGSVFVWALRGAVELKGDYRSAMVANGYYARLANEINTVCAQNRLKCLPERSTLTPPWHAEYLPQILKSLGFIVKSVMQFQHLPRYLSEHAVVHTLSPIQSAIVRGSRITINPNDFQKPLGCFELITFYQWFGFYMMVVILVICGVTNKLMRFTNSVQRFEWLSNTLRSLQLLSTVKIPTYSLHSLWLLNIAILLAILIRCLLVAVIDTTSWVLIVDPSAEIVKPSFVRYLLPVYPLLIIFTVSTLYIVSLNKYQSKP